MPFVLNRGVRIHYEVEGNGPPLVLQHGFTDSPMIWYERGYVDELKRSYRLVLVSARGHHLSDKPHEPDAYGIDAFVSDILAVLDALGLSRAHYLGYSMGGWIGFGLAKNAPRRVSSVIIGGASPSVAAPGAPDPYMPILIQGASALHSFYEGFLTPELEARLLASDMKALIACRRKRFESPGFDDWLADILVPSLVFAGDADATHQGAKEAAAKMPKATFLSIVGCKHVPALYKSELVLPHVANFLGDNRDVKWSPCHSRER